MTLVPAKPWYSQANAQRVVSLCFFGIAMLGVANAVLLLNVGIAFLYLLLLVVVAPFLSRWQLVTIAAICAAFAEGFSHLSDGYLWIPRVVFIFVTYTFVALLVRELVVYRRAAARHVRELEADLQQLHSAEQRLELLLNSSAVGIITVSPDGTILTSNKAGHEIFSVGVGGLVGKSLQTFLPAGHALSHDNGTPVETSVLKANGQRLDARLWSSSFTSDGTNVTVMIVEPLTGQMQH